MLAKWNETFRSFFKTKYKIWKTFSLNGSDLGRLLSFFFFEKTWYPQGSYLPIFIPTKISFPPLGYTWLTPVTETGRNL